MTTPEPVDPPSALPRGTRLGEFEIRRVLGVGGFGIVYLAFDHALEREVAVKEYMPASLVGRTEALHVSLLSQSNAETFSLGLRSFVNEARLLARFDHPSLVKVHRYWEDHNTAYMAMPFYRGSNLHAERKRMGHVPDEAWLRSILEPLLGALDLLHAEGVYHRDISPDNVILQPDGRPVLLDFGAARRVLSDKSMALTAILKPAYAPIEQYAETGNVKQGPWTDLYSLGATVHFLLLGRAPAPATTRTVDDEMTPLAMQQLPGCSAGFAQIIDWMLRPRPADRPQSVGAVREALARGAPPPQAQRDLPAAPAEGWARTQVQSPQQAAAVAPTMVDVSARGHTQPPQRVDDFSDTVMLTRAQGARADDDEVAQPAHGAALADAAAPAVQGDIRPTAPPAKAGAERSGKTKSKRDRSSASTAQPAPPKPAAWPWAAAAGVVLAGGLWWAMRPAAGPAPAVVAAPDVAASAAAVPASVASQPLVAAAPAAAAASPSADPASAAPPPAIAAASVPAPQAKPAPAPTKSAAATKAAVPAPAPTTAGGPPSLATSITKLPPAEPVNPPPAANRAASPAPAHADAAKPATTSPAPASRPAPAPTTRPAYTTITPSNKAAAAPAPAPTAAPAAYAADPEPVVMQSRVLSPSERCGGRVLIALWTCIENQCKDVASLRDHPECVKLRKDREQKLNAAQ